MAFMFERLEVYQKAVDFAEAVGILTEGFPRGKGYLHNQVNRAALSISTNIAEGNGRSTAADRRGFFIIARGSAQECVPLLEISRRGQLIGAERHSELKRDLETIAKMISGLINGLGKNH
jgi:four helix bundle protein